VADRRLAAPQGNPFPDRSAPLKRTARHDGGVNLGRKLLSLDVWDAVKENEAGGQIPLNQEAGRTRSTSGFSG